MPKSGAKVAEGAMLARDLANEPSNVATPKYLARRARTIAEKYGMELEVLDRAGIEEEGLTGLSTVGRSASNEPYFIVLEHHRGGDSAPVVLIGKAVTFDSGWYLHKAIGRNGGHEVRHERRRGRARGDGGRQEPSTYRSTSSPSCRRPRTCPAGTLSSPATCGDALGEDGRDRYDRRGGASDPR